MRSDIRSSSEAPECEVACSTSSRRLVRTIAMRSSSSVVVVAAAATTAFGLRGAKAFLAAARLLRGAAAFFAAARGLRVFAAFLAAFPDFAAFFPAGFLAPDFDLAMFSPQPAQCVELLAVRPVRP